MCPYIDTQTMTQLVKTVSQLVKDVGAVDIMKELGFITLIAQQYSIDEDDLEKCLNDAISIPLKKPTPKAVVAAHKNPVAKPKTTTPKATTPKAATPKSTTSDVVSSSDGVTIDDYNEKAIVVRGDTKAIKEILKECGGKWNDKLRDGAGWIFSKTKRDDLCAKLTLEGIAYTDSCDVSSSTPLPKEVSTPQESVVFKALDETARKALTAALKQWEGKYNATTKCYTFDKKYRTKVDAVLKKHDAKYSIVDDKAPSKAAPSKTTTPKATPPKTAPVASVAIVKNEYGNLWDAKSGIVFEKEGNNLIAIGVQEGDEVLTLEDAHIAICKKRKWTFRTEDATTEEHDDQQDDTQDDPPPLDDALIEDNEAVGSDAEV